MNAEPSALAESPIASNTTVKPATNASAWNIVARAAARVGLRLELLHAGAGEEREVGRDQRQDAGRDERQQPGEECGQDVQVAGHGTPGVRRPPGPGLVREVAPRRPSQERPSSARALGCASLRAVTTAGEPLVRLSEHRPDRVPARAGRRALVRAFVPVRVHLRLLVDEPARRAAAPRADHATRSRTSWCTRSSAC